MDLVVARATERQDRCEAQTLLQLNLQFGPTFYTLAINQDTMGAQRRAKLLWMSKYRNKRKTKYYKNHRLVEREGQSTTRICRVLHEVALLSRCNKRLPVCNENSQHTIKKIQRWLLQYCSCFTYTSTYSMEESQQINSRLHVS